MSATRTPPPPAGPPPPILRAPAELVPTRTLAAEAAASAALALAQSPALWEALHTLGLMLEAQEAHTAEPSALGAALADLLAGAATTPADAIHALELVETLDRTARTWAMLAHPGARLAVQPVPVLGIVS